MTFSQRHYRAKAEAFSENVKTVLSAIAVGRLFGWARYLVISRSGERIITPNALHVLDTQILHCECCLR